MAWKSSLSKVMQELRCDSSSTHTCMPQIALCALCARMHHLISDKYSVYHRRIHMCQSSATSKGVRCGRYGRLALCCCRYHSQWCHVCPLPGTNDPRPPPARSFLHLQRSDFVLSSYAELKKANPDLPILVREASGAEAKLIARFGALLFVGCCFCLLPLLK